jgi:hypothetical protein
MLGVPMPQQDRAAVLLRSKGALRISPENPDVVEVECEVELVPTLMCKRAWIPLTEVIALAPGDFFDFGKWDVRRVSRQTREVKNLVLRCEAKGPQGDSGFNAISPNGARVAGRMFRNRTFWVDDRQNPPIAIEKDEFTRFMVGAFGSFHNRLLSLSSDFDRELEAMYDPRRTSLDGETLYVAPRPGYDDRAAIYQLALLLTEPDYAQALSQFGRSMRLAIVNDEKVFPILSPPAAGMDIKIGIDDGLRHVAGFKLPTFPEAVIATRIFADRRSLRFNKIIVEVPFGWNEDGLGDDASEAISQPVKGSGQRKFGQRIRVDHHLRPGRRGGVLVMPRGNLFSLFPSLRRTELEIRAEQHIVRRRSSENVSSSENLYSSLPPIGDSPVRQLRYNSYAPGMISRTEPAWDEARENFLGGDMPAVNRVSLLPSELPEPIMTFVDAGNICANAGDPIDFELSSLRFGAAATVKAFELGRQHGRWGWASRQKRGRRIFAHVLNLNDETVAAFEIERVKRGEHFAIGLMWTRQPLTEASQLSDYIARISQRNSEPHSRGTWPSLEYKDARFATLIHCANRDIPNILAEAIVNKAYHLCGPEGRRQDF